MFCYCIVVVGGECSRSVKDDFQDVVLVTDDVFADVVA